MQLNARSGRLQFQQYAKITIRVVRVNRLLYQFARSELDDSVQPERRAFGDLRFHQLVHLVQLLFVMRSQITFLADIVRNAVELTAACLDVEDDLPASVVESLLLVLLIQTMTLSKLRRELGGGLGSRSGGGEAHGLGSLTNLFRSND